MPRLRDANLGLWAGGETNVLRIACLMALSWMLVSQACGSSEKPKGSAAVRAQAAHASEFERAMLEDGFVSPEEYERAVLATLQCLGEHGIVHSDPTLHTTQKQSRWQFTYTYPLEEKEKFEQIARDCEHEFEDDILAGLALQEEPSEQELVEMQRQVISCLHDRGVEFEDWDALNAARTSLDAEDGLTVARCTNLIFNGEEEPHASTVD